MRVKIVIINKPSDTYTHILQKEKKSYDVVILEQLKKQTKSKTENKIKASTVHKNWTG